MLLYVHVPFCRRKCGYCAFSSEVLPHDGKRAVDDYLENLHAEIALWGTRLGRTPVESVFLGGGTPSLVEPEAVGAILENIRGTFAVCEDAEISMEANPDSLHSPERAAGYLAAGINRISLGVQSLNDAKLARLGRLHRAEEAVRAVAAIREAGCRNLNLDLMWGLPEQNLEQWQDDIRKVLDLEPDHVSAYGLTLEPGTPLGDAVNVPLPAEEMQTSMYLEAVRLFEEAGLHQYEVSNYARTGYRCRHNQGYWEGRDYLGFGPAATSTLHGKRWTNPTDRTVWASMLAHGDLVAEQETLDQKTRILELMMLRLRTVDGLPLATYEVLSGQHFAARHGNLAHRLAEAGLARLDADDFRLTTSGMLVSNEILGELFDEEDGLHLSCSGQGR